MKKQVTDFVKSLGGITNYSGKDKTMYIKGTNADDISDKVLDKFGYNLPFTLSIP